MINWIFVLSTETKMVTLKTYDRRHLNNVIIIIINQYTLIAILLLFCKNRPVLKLIVNFLLEEMPFFEIMRILLQISSRNKVCYLSCCVKEELNHKIIDFSSFEHLGIIEQLYEVF